MRRAILAALASASLLASVVGAIAAPALGLETPILELMEDPRTLAVLDRMLPGLSERMRDPEVATIFANTSLDDLSKDRDHGRALTPEAMARIGAALQAAQTTDQTPPTP